MCFWTSYHRSILLCSRHIIIAIILENPPCNVFRLEAFDSMVSLRLIQTRCPIISIDPGKKNVQSSVLHLDTEPIFHVFTSMVFIYGQQIRFCPFSYQETT